MGLLRLLTTAAAMGQEPLTMAQAWAVHDQLYSDDRVTFFREPPQVDAGFRAYVNGGSASPKVWSDAWLLAFAEAAGRTVVTLDRGLASRGALCLLPE